MGVQDRLVAWLKRRGRELLRSTHRYGVLKNGNKKEMGANLKIGEGRGGSTIL